MTNYVNFIKGKIRPAIIQAYLDGAGTEADFIGEDSSTGDYTKFGYTLAVAKEMVDEGTANNDVKAIVSQLSGYTDQNNKKNYQIKSSSGYSTLDMLIFSARNDQSFTFASMDDFFVDSIMAYVNSNIMVSASATTAAPMHMLVEFMQNAAIGEVSADALANENVGDTHGMVSPLLYALKRAADNNMSADRLATYNAVKTKMDLSDYDQGLGPNSTSVADSVPTNNLTRFIAGASHDSIILAAEEMVSLVPGTPMSTADIMSCVTKADGLSKNHITFDLGVYAGHVSGGNNKGYSPLFYYISRFKGACNVSVLDHLATKFSPFAISLEGNSTDGYNPLSVLAASLVLQDDGTWDNLELAAWIKQKLTSLSATNGYQLFAGAGNVRDLSGGKSPNAYGVVTNLLIEVNKYHRKQADLNQEDANWVFNPGPVLSPVFPAVIDGTLYEEWMVEFGQEI